MNRRNFLHAAGACLGAGVLPALMSGTVRAQSASYRALVCIFLRGGNDGTNTIVPRDATRYTQYAAVRKQLALPHLRPPACHVRLQPMAHCVFHQWLQQHGGQRLCGQFSG